MCRQKNITYPVHVRLVISSSAKSVLSVTISPMMLSKLPSALSFYLVSITVVHFSPPKLVSFKRSKNNASLVVLPGVTTSFYLLSYVLYTGFLRTPAFSTNFFFLLLNYRTTKLLSICLFSSSMFRLANCFPILHSFVFHRLTSSLLVDEPSSSKNHYSGTSHPVLLDTPLP